MLQGGRFSFFRLSLLHFPQKRLILRLLKILLNAVKKKIEFPYPDRYFDPMILLSQPNINRNSFYKFHKTYPNLTSLQTHCGPSKMTLNNILTFQFIRFSKFLPRNIKENQTNEKLIILKHL